MYGLVRASLALVYLSYLIVIFLIGLRPVWRDYKVSERVSLRETHGQGLVEYALILVLVAVVVIVSLMVLGPTVGELFSHVKTALEFGASEDTVADAAAGRTGQSNGNDLRVTFRVLTDTTVQVTDSQSGQTQEVACSAGSCSVTLTAVGHAAGTITITTPDGRTTTIEYPAKP